MSNTDRLNTEEVSFLAAGKPANVSDEPTTSEPRLDSAELSPDTASSRPVLPRAPAPHETASGTVDDARDGLTQRRDMARLVRGIHDRCGRNVALALSELLRTPVDIRLHDVAFIEYRQFILDVESPTCLAVLRAEPLDVPLALDLRPTLLFAMMNCLLGGRPRDEEPPDRPLTEIEQRLAARIVRVWSHELRSAWRDVAPVEPTFERWEVHPHRAALAPLREPLMVTRFRLTMGAIDELVMLAIPRRAVDELPRRISMGQESSRAMTSAGARPHLATHAADSAELEVCLGGIRVSSADLHSLRIGDVIATNHSVEAPLFVTVENQPRYVGRPGVVQGRRAIRIEAELDADQGAELALGVDVGRPAVDENQR